MSDLKMNFDKLNKACKEVNEKWGNMMKENNPFDTISKIAKDIADRQDKEVALEFTKHICTLLKNNGVSPMIDEYKQNFVKENSVEQKYGVAITGLDFTEHDKRFRDEIASLKRQIEKLEIIRTRCHESARDSFDLVNYGCLHIVTADELKTTKDENDRTVELPFDPLETANMLINSTFECEASNLEKLLYKCGDIRTTERYSIEDLEQIAEHLLVYCKHNRKEDE